MSPKVQNELTNICRELIQKGIVANVNNAKALLVLVDETADITSHEQVSICVRYTKSERPNFLFARNNFYVLLNLVTQWEKRWQTQFFQL